MNVKGKDMRPEPPYSVEIHTNKWTHEPPHTYILFCKHVKAKQVPCSIQNNMRSGLCTSSFHTAALLQCVLLFMSGICNTHTRPQTHTHTHAHTHTHTRAHTPQHTTPTHQHTHKHMPICH